MTQPEALRLADALCRLSVYLPKPQDMIHAAAELRRLYEANEAFGKRQEWWNERMFALEQQRDALLEALKQVEPILARMYGQQAAELPPMQIVRAAIKKAEENT